MVFAPFRSDYGNVWTYLSFQVQMNKKERVIFEFEMGVKKFVGILIQVVIKIIFLEARSVNWFGS